MIDETKGAFALRGRKRRAVLSLAPLIDVTFILLIFFMLVTQFERFAAIDVTLEPGVDISELRRQGPGTESLLLTIQADGMIRLKETAPIALNELREALAKRIDRPASTDTDKLVLAVAPEPDVPLQLLIDVLSIVQESNATPRIIVPGTEKGGAK